MCSIQWYGFIINGNIVSQPCSAIHGNTITVRLDTLLDTDDVGISIQPAIAMSDPNGSATDFFAPFIPISANQVGTVLQYTFDLTSYVTLEGTYIIQGVGDTLSTGGACSGQFQTPRGCTSLTYTASSLSSIIISPTSYSLGIGGTQQLTAICLDASNNHISVPITWTSNNLATASVNSNGLVTATNNAGTVGSAIIIATHANISGASTVRVSPSPTHSICSNNTCISTSGAGTDTCLITQPSTCGTPQCSLFIT